MVLNAIQWHGQYRDNTSIMNILKWKYDGKLDNDEGQYTCTYYVTLFIDMTYMTKKYNTFGVSVVLVPIRVNHKLIASHMQTSSTFEGLTFYQWQCNRLKLNSILSKQQQGNNYITLLILPVTRVSLKFVVGLVETPTSHLLNLGLRQVFSFSTRENKRRKEKKTLVFMHRREYESVIFKFS